MCREPGFEFIVVHRFVDDRSTAGVEIFPLPVKFENDKSLVGGGAMLVVLLDDVSLRPVGRNLDHIYVHCPASEKAGYGGESDGSEFADLWDEHQNQKGSGDDRYQRKFEAVIIFFPRRPGTGVVVNEKVNEPFVSLRARAGPERDVPGGKNQQAKRADQSRDDVFDPAL